MHFEISPRDEKSFAVTKIEGSGNETFPDVTFSESDDPDLFNVLKEVFSGRCKISRLELDEKGPTGTWSYIYLIKENDKIAIMHEPYLLWFTLNDGSEKRLYTLRNLVQKLIK